MNAPEKCRGRSYGYHIEGCDGKCWEREKRARKRKRPSRRDLLLVIGELQGLIGEIQAVDNDRNQRREDDKQPLFARAHELCVDARSFDPPIDGGSRAGWPYPKGE